MRGVAVVGLGVGEQHARTYAASPTSSLRWVHDLDASRAERVARELGNGRPPSSFQAILDDPETSVVSIASYDDSHAEQVVAALRARKHVFCEKPLCTTEAQLAAVHSAWSDTKRGLACNLVLRAAPAFRWLRDAISKGEFGDIYAFDGDYLYGRLHKILEGWRGKADGYSVMVGGGVHMVDLMLWLTGQIPDRVNAVGSRLATRDTSFRYDDYASATFQYSSGLVGRISANFACVHRHAHVVRVYGTKKTFLLDDQGPRVFSSRGDDKNATRLDLSPLPSHKGDLIPSFLESLDDPAKIVANAQHEFRVAAACLAADRARNIGQTVPIEYP